MTALCLPDDAARADLATYAGRALAIAPTGSMRLVGAGTPDRPALACFAGVLDGAGLFGNGLVVGLRVVELAAPFAAEVTTSTTALAALLAGDGPLDVTAGGVPPRWTAQAPPRSGWAPLGLLDAADLVEASRSKDVQAQVDGLPTGITHAVAIAVRGLGFLPEAGGPDAASANPVLFQSGSWLRLSTPLGHVLTRR